MRFALAAFLLAGCAQAQSSVVPIQTVERQLLLFPQQQKSQRSKHCGMCCALPRRDGVRVWYTGNCAGGYHICRADFDRNWNLVDESDGPCLSPGHTGEFDSSAVFMPCVVSDGKRLRMYYAAHAEGPFPGNGSSAGLAFSDDDGLTWKKAGQTLSATGADEFGIGSHCVWHDNNEWRMIYTHISAPGGRFFLNYAQSTDGITWSRPPQNLAFDYGPNATSARPCVWKEGERYLMLFTCAVNGTPNRVRLAESADGRKFHFRKQVLDIAPDSHWDNECVCYAWAVPERGLMIYTGNNFGTGGFGIARLHVD